MPTADYLNDAAQTMGSKLADSVASAAGSFVVGQLLSAVGLNNDPTAAIQAELGQILAGIQKIEDDIAALKTDMDAAMAQLEYSVIENNIRPYLTQNTTIFKAFNVFATAAQSDLPSEKAAILDLFDASILEAPAAWNTVLGGDGTSPNLIDEWNKVVRLHHAFFGPDAATALGTHWAWLDAQQAQSILYCVEYQNETGNRAAARQTLIDWRTNRTAQLALLRGMPFDTDVFTYTSNDPATTSPQTVTTPVKSAASLATITDIDGAPMMYCLKLGGPLSHGNDPYLADFNAHYLAAAQWAAEYPGFTVQGVETDTPTSWNVPSIGTLIEFLNKCGGSVGQGGADSFAGALRNQGFEFPPGTALRLWTDVNRLGGTPMPPGMATGPFRSIFVDGDSWWNPSTSPDDSAYFVLQRRLNDGEADNYWYS